MKIDYPTLRLLIPTIAALRLAFDHSPNDCLRVQAKRGSISSLAALRFTLTVLAPRREVVIGANLSPKLKEKEATPLLLFRCDRHLVTRNFLDQ